MSDKLLKNENIKGYRKTRLGWIPENWKIIKFGDCFNLSSGERKPENFELKNDSNKTIPVYGGNGICGYTNQILKNEELIIIGRVGEHCGCIHYVKGPCWITDNALYTKSVKRNFFKKFLAYLLIYIKLGKFRNKGGQPLISQKIIYEKQFIIPPLPEQQKIAQILSTWDRAIEKTEQLIVAKSRHEKALRQQLITGKKRFKEFMKIQGYKKIIKLGKVPEDWKVFKASKIFDRYSDKNHSEEELLSVTQNKGVLPRNMLEGRVMMPAGEVNTYKLVNIGDFVISLRSFQGGIEYSEYKGIVSPAYTVIKNTIPIEPQYYKYLFKSVDFISRLSIAVIGIRDGKQISYNDFAGIKIYYPSVKEQKKIALILNTYNKEIELLNKKLEALKKQKKGIMQKLLTGQVRVKV